MCKEKVLIFVMFVRLVVWSLNQLSIFLLTVKWLREDSPVNLLNVNMDIIDIAVQIFESGSS